MTGCQADYGDDRHCGNCQSLASDIPVQEVIIHRQECERPELVYHQLSAQGQWLSSLFPICSPPTPVCGGFSLRGFRDLGQRRC